MNYIYIFLLFLLFSKPQIFIAQSNTFIFNSKENTKKEIKKKLLAEINNINNINKFKLNQVLIFNGYFNSKIDSTPKDSIENTYFITLNQPYKWIDLKIKKENLVLIESIFNKPLNTGVKESRFNIKKLKSIYEKTISYLENNGYPFAQVHLSDVVIQKQTIKGTFNIDKKQLITIDSISVLGNNRINKFLENHLRIHPKSHYNESIIKQSIKRIKQTGFLELKELPDVLFYKTSAIIFYNIKIKKSNHFNGIAGILTNEKTGKINFVGNLNLKLHNNLQKGEKLNLDWNALPNSSQKLNINFELPYFLNTPFGIRPNLYIFKQDSTFLTTNLKLGAFYLYGNSKISIDFSIENSNLLGENFENITQLPDYNSFKKKKISINFEKKNLDNLIIPKNGFSIEAAITGGEKQIIKVPSIKPELYNNLTLRTYIYRVHLSTNFYKQFGKFFVAKLSTRNGFIFNNQLFENELYRLGGINSLKGFNENSIPVSQFITIEIEPRILLDKSTYFNLFFNQSFTKKDIFNNTSSDQLYGFGGGLAFLTKAGLFSINYALGSQQNNPILFKSGKIHFGFISFF